jgi:hypothetical protein
MKSLLAKVFGLMALVAVVYCNYHAVKDSAPFFKRQLNRVRGSKAYTRVSGWVDRVTSSNIVQGTKAKATSAGGRVVHMFKRRETA